MFNFVRAALDGAVDAELLGVNPAKGIRSLLVPRPDNAHANFFTPDQMGRILRALRPHPDPTVPEWPSNACGYTYEQVALAAYTGARRDEVQAQRWEWIDWAGGTIRVHTSKVLRRGVTGSPC